MTLQSLIAHYGLDQALAIIAMPDTLLKAHMLQPPQTCPVCRHYPARQEYGVCNMCRIRHEHDRIVEPRKAGERFLFL